MALSILQPEKKIKIDFLLKKKLNHQIKKNERIPPFIFNPFFSKHIFRKQND
jgi:hypothetical protein